MTGKLGSDQINTIKAVLIGGAYTIDDLYKHPKIKDANLDPSTVERIVAYLQEFAPKHIRYSIHPE